jgi:DNA (cytosine-5)-methyltransferase 1
MTTLPNRIRCGEIEAPDVFCGGTPCQAFSVAGLRKGLDDSRGNLSLIFCEIANAIDSVRRNDGREPSVVFWENVPGILSSRDNAFGCFLAGLAGEDDPLIAPGGKWADAGCVFGPERTVAWRILDAQYFGLAQRRKRVFVVASARDGFDPVKVLFEFDGVRRDSAPSREAGQEVAPTIAGCSNGGGSNGPGRDVDSVESLQTAYTTKLHNTQSNQAGKVYKEYATSLDANSPPPAVFQPYSVANCLTARMHKGINTTLDKGQTPVIAHSLRGEGFDASEDGTGRGTPLVPVAFDTTQITSAANYSNPKPGDACHPLAAGAHPPAIAFHPTQDPIISTDGTTHAMGCGSSGGQASVAIATFQQSSMKGKGTIGYDSSGIAKPVKTQVDGQMLQAGMMVRRLLPTECEFLQGFPRDYTAIPWRKKPADQCPDGPRYKALGNSWAVPVVNWIGNRIQNAINETETY